MELFAELRAVAVKQNQESEFPDWLLAEVLEVANHPESYLDQSGAVELLLAQVRDFDPHAGVGCFDTSVSADAVRRTLRLILNR